MVLVEPTPVENLPPVEPTPEPSPQVINLVKVGNLTVLMYINTFFPANPRAEEAEEQEEEQDLDRGC